MADWRQIQARIRKAKNSADAVAKLSELYQRTHDGMVAWELGVVEEKGGRSDEAVTWYKVAAEKFRRADWKKKAEEALTRLGVQPPEKHEEIEKEGEHTSMASEEVPARGEERKSLPLALGEIPDLPEKMHPQASEESSDSDDSDIEEGEEGTAADSKAVEGAPGVAGDGIRKKRRRGRRGGRGRRRKTGANAAGLPDQAFASASSAPVPSHPAAQPMSAASSERMPTERTERAPHEPSPRRPQQSQRFERGERTERSERSDRAERSERTETVHEVPQLPSERAAHGRSDPGLSSRMSHLESLLRRLLNSPLHRLGESDEAPAGPGVFLLSDADQTSSYYIEACQTLRVGVGNLGRSGRSQKGSPRGGGRNFTESNFKEKLAEHLGINEAKVSQYLKDHCVVRWIQLDDEAAHLAHFAIGLLRTPINSD